jgi:DNA-binding NarL/FixJ family response regulator
MGEFSPLRLVVFPLSISSQKSENESGRYGDTGMRFVTVLISDADEVFRQRLCQALIAAGDLQVVGLADSVKQTIELAHRLRPDAILLNAALLNGDGAPAASAGLFTAAKVLLVSEAGLEARTLQLLRWGARGCLVKGEGLLEKLPDAIRTVCRGEAVLSPRLTGWMLDTLKNGLGLERVH